MKATVSISGDGRDIRVTLYTERYMLGQRKFRSYKAALRYTDELLSDPDNTLSKQSSDEYKRMKEWVKLYA